MACRLVLSMVICLSAAAQTAFEVASVKPSEPGGRPQAAGGPLSPDPERWSCLNCTLRGILTHAYAVFEYQIEGPAWMSTAKFDVIVKLPKGAKREEFRLMLQGLLEERFKMKAHRESREIPVYELVIAKGGSKLEEVTTPAPAAPPRPLVDRDGFPNVPGGTGLQVINGRGRMQFRAQTMKNVAHYLSGQVDRPVLDATGLKGTYALILSWRVISPRDAATDPGSGLPIFEAIEEQLGLKLKPAKGAVETIVVDHAEKSPIDN